MQIYDCHPLFEDVQLEQVFPDGKTFVDCSPRAPLPEILERYLEERGQPGFALKSFVLRHFDQPVPFQDRYVVQEGTSVKEHIEKLWDLLVRNKADASGSRLALPFPFVVPGGRFGEMYYWDTYFTMLGLQVSGRTDVLEGIVANFAYLIDTVGYIPNGTRTYFLGRSQPPYFSLMVSLLATETGSAAITRYLPQLEMEYRFWMKGVAEINENNTAAFHAVRMKDGEFLNRYWDDQDTPRPESYRQDVELAADSTDKSALYRHLRVGAESGWDYSTRWFSDNASIKTIHAADLVPVDLNCLIWNLESVIARGHELQGDTQEADRYLQLAADRKKAIRKYCWHPVRKFFFDHDYLTNSCSHAFTIAAATPLYFGIATQEEAENVIATIKDRFLVAGGVQTTLENSGEQWDAPNGWAPLQWITILGLENYGADELAETIAQRWIRVNTEVFGRTGKLMEKYNVVDTRLEAGGGEYAGQDGFGWTNGVLLALIRKYG